MNDTKSSNSPRMMGNIFGIFMILVYIGMGVLFYIDFFQFAEKYQWVRWLFGTCFVLYGIWRAYRQIRANCGSDDNQ